MSTWKLVIKLLDRGLLDLRSLIGMKIPIDEWERAFEAVKAKEALKVLIIP